MKWLARRKRIRDKKKLTRRMLALNEQQRIEALNDRHPVQRERGES